MNNVFTYTRKVIVQIFEKLLGQIIFHNSLYAWFVFVVTEWVTYSGQFQPFQDIWEGDHWPIHSESHIGTSNRRNILPCVPWKANSSSLFKVAQSRLHHIMLKYTKLSIVRHEVGRSSGAKFSSVGHSAC